MRRWTRMSRAVTAFVGSGKALGGLGVLIAAWLVWGVEAVWGRPWELVVTTGAPILTLVLVMIMQHSQNRDGEATHLKLNELLLALEQPSNDVVSAEVKSDEELVRLAGEHRKAAGSPDDRNT